MAINMPITAKIESIQEFIKPGNRFAVYFGGKTFVEYEIENYVPFRLKTPITIPANQLQYTITYQTNLSPGNPLQQIYNTPSDYPVFYIIGLTWNSPFVELYANDPSGTPYWQIGPSLQTPIYLEGDIFDPVTWFGAVNNRVPIFNLTRRTTDTLTPYPINLPLSFILMFLGYAIRVRNLGNIPIDQATQLPFTIWLMSTNSYVYSPSGGGG